MREKWGSGDGRKGEEKSKGIPQWKCIQKRILKGNGTREENQGRAKRTGSEDWLRCTVLTPEKISTCIPGKRMANQGTIPPHSYFFLCCYQSFGFSVCVGGRVCLGGGVLPCYSQGRDGFSLSNPDCCVFLVLPMGIIQTYPPPMGVGSTTILDLQARGWKENERKITSWYQ